MNFRMYYILIRNQQLSEYNSTPTKTLDQNEDETMNAKYSKHLSPDEGSNSAESDYKTQPIDISSSPQVLLTPPYTSLPEDRSVFFYTFNTFSH